MRPADGSGARGAPRGGSRRVSAGSETRRKLVRLLQLAFSGELAAALAYQGHARSVKSPQERAMITKIEKDECEHRQTVGRLLADLGARPRKLREVRAFRRRPRPLVFVPLDGMVSADVHGREARDEERRGVRPGGRVCRRARPG
ncbi:MAG: ferritin-like domain-containing protein [Thermoanaerobaculia bacterium]